MELGKFAEFGKLASGMSKNLPQETVVPLIMSVAHAWSTPYITIRLEFI